MTANEENWRDVYQLKDDERHISSVQKATLETREFGLEPTHGLFCSPEWWRQIESGNLRVHTLLGTISRVFMGSMNDWPEFEMRCADGSTHQFTRFVTPAGKGFDHLYEANRRIEVDFVWQEWRRGAADWGRPNPTKVVTAIRISVAH